MKVRLLYSFVMALAIAIAFTTLNQNVQAQDPMAAVTGAGTINTIGNLGDPLNGGTNQTGGTFTYNASDPAQASGFGNLNGSGKTNGTTGPTGGQLTSSALFGANVGAAGAQNNVTLNGFAGQSAWQTFKFTPGNFIDGGEGSGGNLIGSASNIGPLCDTPSSSSLSGNAGANGSTTMSFVANPNGNSAMASGKNAANSNVNGAVNGNNPSMALNVTGSTGLEGGVLVSRPNGSGAEGNFFGTGTYGNALNGPGNLNGGSYTNGLSKVWMSPTGNSAGAYTSVSSGAGTTSTPAGH